MVKRILFTVLILLVLTSCISITTDIKKLPTPSQDFVTATLMLAKAPLTTATLTAAPESVTTSTLSAVVSASCTNAAILLRDVTIQDDTHVTPRERITKIWEFQNTGTCPWVNSTIKFSSGDQMSAPLSVPVAETQPNSSVQVSVELTAPTADGHYAGYFTLLSPNGEVIPIGGQMTFWVKLIVGTEVISYAASGETPAPPGSCIQSQNANYVSEILSLINTERANAGLQILTSDPQMAAFAQSHAEDMAFHNFLSHDGSDGSFGERMAAYSITFGEPIGGEILAIGTPQNAMDQWRRDEHWDFVLRPHYTRVGVGYAYSSCSDFGGYITVDFGG